MSAPDLSHGGVGQPAVNAFPIAPHNTNELVAVTRAIYVGGAGDVEIVTKGGDTVVFSAVPVGTIIPVRAKIVKADNTTASLLLGLY